MFVSIAMTTYNGEKYLREQIDSIITQTIQEFELIVCDDCSTDTTWNILKEYQQKDNRIWIYRNEHNLGFKKNFEKAMKLCKGDFIALSDQDDIWMPNHLQVLLSKIGNRMMSCGNCMLIDGENHEMNVTYQQEELLDSIPQNTLHMAYSIILFRNPFQGASMLINRCFFDKILPIPEGVGFHDSWIAALSCFNGGFSYSDTIITNYRMHGNNITKVRVKRKNRWVEFMKNVKNPCIYDRMAMLNSINKRLSLTNEEKRVLETIRRIVNRDSLLSGRFLNILFKIRHFKLIYSS